jgi:nucleoside-diphosphate-sugar epimerase
VKKVLLTGASGFIGRQCLSPLIRGGYEVHAVRRDRPASDGRAKDVEWHQLDLLDRSRVSKLLGEIRPTHLLHCAWYAVPGKYWEAPENHQWVEASLHLFRTFAKVGGQRAVGVGSCAEYDWSFGRCSETTTPLNPTTTYGICKRNLYDDVMKLQGDNRLSVAWGRLFFLYGPHERRERFVPSMINPILRGERAQCSHGGQIRDYLYVKDAAAALVSLLDSSVTGPVNIASGNAVTLQQIAKTIGAKLGRPDLVTFGETESTEPREIAAETSRLNKEVGWSPQYNLDLGLEETIGWWERRRQNSAT